MMELRKKYHPPIIVFCQKCCMPIFPTLGPNNLSVLMNGSKLSCSACNSEFDVRLEFTERAAEQLRAPTEAGGESCMCEKPLDDDGWRCIGCGKLLAPRLGG